MGCCMHAHVPVPSVPVNDSLDLVPRLKACRSELMANNITELGNINNAELCIITQPDKLASVIGLASCIRVKSSLVQDNILVILDTLNSSLEFFQITIKQIKHLGHNITSSIKEAETPVLFYILLKSCARSYNKVVRTPFSLCRQLNNCFDIEV